MKTALLPAWNLLLWPLWWYSQGFWWLLRKLGGFLVNEGRSLNISVWVRNLFVPMFGQVDRAGKIISFFIRAFMIVGKAVMWLLSLIPISIVLLLWLVAPPFVIYLLVGQIF